MEFPVFVRLGPLALHPHVLFETLAYFAGFRLYVVLRDRRGDHLSEPKRWMVIAAGAIGAALGSKLLSLAADPLATAAQWRNPVYLLGGKTILGALIGGLIAVEWAKRRMGETRATGDLFAVPLALGIAIGRVGCFLTGLDDHTHGLPANLPWAVDYGDGVPRHPAQLYEIGFLVTLAAALAWLNRRPHREGDVFKAFMVGYFGFRLLLECFKPGVPLAGLTTLQWACVAVLAYYAQLRVRASRAPAPDDGQARSRSRLRIDVSPPNHDLPERARVA